MWTLHPNQYANWSKCKHERFDGNTVKKNELQGGSVVCFAQHIGGPYSVEKNVQEIADEENINKLNSIETLKKFNSDLQLYKNEINSILDNLILQGKTIAGFGSARSATTLISYFDISKKIDFIVDDNEMKHFKFTPQNRIQIFPSDYMYKKESDCMIIFAWELNNLLKI